MVTHVLGSTQVGALPSGSSYYFAASTSPYPSCRPARNILLHYNRLVELAAGKNSVLVHLRECY